MTAIRFLIAILPSILLGYFLVSLVLKEPVFQPSLFRFFLGCAAGVGLSFCLFFGWSLLLDPTAPGYILTEIILIVIVGIILKKNNLLVWDKNKTGGIKSLLFTPYSVIAMVVFLCALTAAIIAFYGASLDNPHGRYDAWAVWSLDARFFLRGGENWKNLFSPILYVPDYPLLLPATIARAWMVAGEEIPRFPTYTAAFFTFGLAGLLAAALSQLKSYFWGFLAAAVLLCSPWLIQYGASQIADIPLAFFILAASITLYRSILSDFDRPGEVVLTGFFAGLAAWTKNEGLVFLAVVCAILFLAAIFNRKQTTWWKTIFFFAAGLAIPLAELLYFKTYLVPSNHFIAQDNQIILLKLMMPERYAAVFSSFLQVLRYLGGWEIPLLGILLLAGVLFGIGLPKGQKKAPIFLFLVIVLQIGGYFFTYIITPFPLQWHIDRSFSRIIMHILPVFLLLLFSIYRNPQVKKPVSR